MNGLSLQNFAKKEVKMGGVYINQNIVKLLFKVFLDENLAFYKK